MTGPDAIRALARRCAAAGLRRTDALALFDALAIGDALALENGNITRAAERLEVDRLVILRRRTRAFRKIGGEA